jgi:hypothetical protein
VLGYTREASSAFILGLTKDLKVIAAKTVEAGTDKMPGLQAMSLA